jgi:hypothetical protein
MRQGNSNTQAGGYQKEPWVVYCDSSDMYEARAGGWCWVAHLLHVSRQDCLYDILAHHLLDLWAMKQCSNVDGSVPAYNASASHSTVLPSLPS